MAIGLFSLFVLPVPFLRSVGYGGRLIPLVALIAAITLLQPRGRIRAQHTDVRYRR